MSDLDRALTISDRLLAWDMLDSASSVLERNLEKHPYHPELLRRLGRVRLAQGLPQEAIPFLKLAIQHDGTVDKKADSPAPLGLRRVADVHL
ncbi:MAG: hypothetical protein HKN70_09960 [Gammaproteobacteria bacterium]|nr:hypothetical protein [Gammaproteobacteria bacterium]